MYCNRRCCVFRLLKHSCDRLNSSKYRPNLSIRSMKSPRITLEQWQALVAVVDAGSYARAAELLHKTQSTLTYAVQKIESLLDVKAFDIKGRKAVLTPTGQLLYRRARLLLDEATATESAARRRSAG